MQETRLAGFYSLCVCPPTPQGQTIKEHLKRWQSSPPERQRGGVCRCMDSMCMFLWSVCVCALRVNAQSDKWGCNSEESARLYLGKWRQRRKRKKGSLKHHLKAIYANFFSLADNRSRKQLGHFCTKRQKRENKRDRVGMRESKRARLCEEQLWKSFCGAITKGPQKTQWHRNVN